MDDLEKKDTPGDIVKRLRDSLEIDSHYGKCVQMSAWDYDLVAGTADLIERQSKSLDEAADRIEALMRARQALKKFETMVRDDDYDAKELIEEFAEIARKALNETE